MATVTIHSGFIEIRFSGWERLFTGRSAYTVPVTSVSDVDHVDEPIRLARGTRRGLAVNGVAKIGVWGLVRGPRMLFSARRGVPGLVLTLRGTPGGFDGVVISVENAGELAERIRRTRIAA